VKERVVLVGLDGGEPSLLRPLMADVCPNLARLAAEGAWGAFRSVVPPLSPPAWATLMTGMNPGKHGVFDFFHMPFRDRGSYVRRLITSACWRASGLWDHTTSAGRSACFFNMPMCWPPPFLNGYFVCGLGAPGGSALFTYPAALGDRLPGVVLEPGDGTTMGDPAAFLARCELSGGSMLETAERLWREREFDLFCVALTLPDRFQHLFWRELAAGEPRVSAVYRRWFEAFDAFLGRLLDSGSTVVLFSDHGFGPVEGYFHVNRWLHREGLLCVRDRGALGTPDGLLTAIDWDLTRAYALGEYGEIRLNRRGREPLGVVAPGAEAQALVGELTARLRVLADADGRVVEEIRRGADVYEGPFADEAPDLVFRLRGHRILCRIDGRGRDLLEPDGPLFVPADRPEHYRGAHRLEGLLAAWGPLVRRPAEPLAAHAADLAPTVLHLLGLPLDRAMDGRVLHEMLAEPLASRAPAWEDGVAAATRTGAAAYAPAEEERVAERLRELGYLE
jgi:predicted AlkP superfamily phosphohydrolase/phosphomutase